MRVAVLGGTGCGGRALMAALRRRGHTAWSLARGTQVAPDIVCERAALRATLADLSPDALVDHAPCDVAGVTATLAALPPGCRYSHLSTAIVCGPWRRTPYDAREPPAPASVYGRMRRRCELSALERPGTQVFRLGALYGPGHAPITPWGRDPALVDRLRAGERLEIPRAHVQPWFSVDHGEALCDALEAPGPALVHLAGPVTTWRAWFEAWAEAAGTRAHLVFAEHETLAARAPPALAPFVDALLRPPLLATGPLPATPLVDACARTLG